MRIGLKSITAVALGLVVLQLPTWAANETPAVAAKPAADFKSDKEKASYGVGLYFGNQIKRSNMEVDLDVVNGAISDVLSGKEPKLNEQQAREAIMVYQKDAQKKIAEKNKKDGEAFLAENKKKAGVKTKLITLSETNSAELQYKVLSEGTGATPSSNEVVQVNYKGTLINGKEFDSSSKHAQPGQPAPPAKFPVNRVVRGWTEALQMMKVGSKWEVYLPSTLAYGDNASGPLIEPGSTLIFEMELVGIEAPPAAPAPAQPLTSDIIKVPSAEELKKGAKIEVLKPEEAAKLAEAEAAKKAQADKKPEPKK